MTNKQIQKWMEKKNFISFSYPFYAADAAFAQHFPSQFTVLRMLENVSNKQKLRQSTETKFWR